MKLDAWLRQDHPLAERLRVVECLSQAVNEVHDRGESLAALEPSRIEVGSDGECDVSAARRGSPTPGYAAPERTEGGPPSVQADIYAVGAIAWEILAGRPAGESPSPLQEARPEVPREIAEAVMGCLEHSSEWRPKDLTYLAQTAAAQQRSGRRAPAKPAARAPSPARAAPPARVVARRPSRSHGPLLAAAALLLTGAAAGVWWYQQQGSDEGRVAPRPGTTRVASPTPSAVPGSITPTAPPSGPSPTPTRTPSTTVLPSPAPTAAAGATAPATPVAVATPAPATPAPVKPTARTAAEPVPTPTPATPATPRPTPTPPPATPPPVVTEPASASGAPSAAAPPSTAQPTIPQVPAAPATLTAVSPLTVRRPGKVLLDVRGTGFRPDHRARIVALKQAPNGITISRQKYVNDTLLAVLLELDATVGPGVYGLVLEDQTGPLTSPLTFTVTK
jgi:hypothetical protein